MLVIAVDKVHRDQVFMDTSYAMLPPRIMEASKVVLQKCIVGSGIAEEEFDYIPLSELEKELGVAIRGKFPVLTLEEKEGIPK